MKILFFGDVVGKSGRKALKLELPKLVSEYEPDFVIANAENLTSGKGFNKAKVEELKNAGVDFFTSGDHCWDNKQGVDYLGEDDCLVLRPANYPPGCAGEGFKVIEKNGKRLLVVNVLGRVFMKSDMDCPFRCLDEVLNRHKDRKLDGIFVDFHAEATAEKIAMKWYLDGRVGALVGTHSHVQTADAEVTGKGTAYITDVGMSGAHVSCLGVKKEIIIQKFLTQMPLAHEVEEKGVLEVGGVFVELSDGGKATTITPIRIMIGGS